MTRETAKKQASVIKAYGEGKAIEFMYKDGTWGSAGEIGCPFDPNFEYRIKPEPKTRPMTRGEIMYMITTVPGLVAREKGTTDYYLPGRMDDQDEQNAYEYAIIDKYGEPIDGWHKFEVEE
jgi:hypothetical protein